MVNRESVIPPWQQLADLIRERISSGQYPPGGRIPSVISLSQEFDLAPVTVRKAMTALAREGLVETRTGWGTFVAERD